MRVPTNRLGRALLALLAVLAVAFAACASPAAPSPTAAPANPAAAPTSAPAAPQPAATAPSAAQPAATAAAPAAGKPAAYVIGHVVPLTGSNAELGKSFDQTAQMAVDYVNSHGGVDGVPLKLVSEDSMADPKQGITAFNKLVQVDKVPVILEAWSTVLMATAPVADQTKTVQINYGANAIGLRGVGKYTFSDFPLSDLDSTVLANYVYNTLKARTGAIIYINNDTGISQAQNVKKVFEADGGKIVAYESHQPDAMDFGAQLAKIKATNPDFIHIASLTQESPRIVKQARDMGIKAQLTSYSAVETQEMLDQAGAAANGLIYTSLAPPDTNPEVQNFLNLWKTKYGKIPPGTAYNMYVWDTVATVIPEAIKYAEQKGYGYTGEGIAKAITELKQFDTKVTGKTVFQFPGQDVKKPVTLKKINATDKKFDTITVVQPQ